VALHFFACKSIVRVARLTHRLCRCDDLGAPVSQVGFDSGVNNSSVLHGHFYNSVAPGHRPTP
jgi:hypothetical protein